MVPNASDPVPNPPGIWLPKMDPTPRTVRLPSVSVVAPVSPGRYESTPPLRVTGAVSLMRLPSDVRPFSMARMPTCAPTYPLTVIDDVLDSRPVLPANTELTVRPALLTTVAPV